MDSAKLPKPKSVRIPAITIATYGLFVVFVVLATFLVAKASLAEKAQNAEAAQRTATLMQLAALRQNLLEAESAGQRYLLLENKDYLAEYRERVGVVERRVLDMKSGAGVDTREEAYIETLATHIHRRFALMDSSIELANKPALRQTLAQTVDGAIEETEAIDRILVQLEREQHRAVARTRADR